MDAKSGKISKDKKRSVWCDRDAQILLELWAERASELRRAKRNGHIYKEISVQMNNKFSSEEVHVKIRNFTQKYREEKKQMGPSGGSPSKWKFFNAVHRIIGSNAANSAEVLETFSFVNTPDASCQPSPSSQSLPWLELSQPLPSPESQPLPSPVSQPLPSPVSMPLPSPPVLISPPASPLPSLDTTFSSAAAASSSSGKKRNHLGEVVKIMKEQNVMLKSVVEDSQSLSNEIVKAIQQQNETSKEFMNLMKTLIDKI